ncbi:MAG: AAA family ATPase [Treponema sp.]|jgi:flagellar biosynthesis protein FlhF|nr:AAA family ATPase [Treponema sp.]
MEMFFQQGMSRKDCELKIIEKYSRPFHILSEREIRLGGLFGLFTKPGVEVGFYFSPVVNSHKLDLEEEKKKVIAAAKKNQEQSAALNMEASKAILDSLNEIKQKIDSGSKSNNRQVEEHPAFFQTAQLLRQNDFSEKYIGVILEKLRKELPLETLDNPDLLQDRLLEWIGESIDIYSDESLARKPRIMVLIGPTGVGKTTTIAKLAAIFGLGTSERPAVAVRMITIDAFRIGAKAQLESYGDIMQIPVSIVDNKLDLRKEIALFSDETDLFLVDTIGKSPKDLARLGEIKEILEGCGKGAVMYLVISASTKASDIADILQQFEPFNYRSVVLTKMDETDRVGNVISALYERKKSVSYLTDGQKVPNDIRKASVVRFLMNLDGFKINRDKIEKRFPSGEADQFKWG